MKKDFLAVTIHCETEAASSQCTLLDLLGSVIQPRSAIYAAGPLDTGQLYYEQVVRGTPDPIQIRCHNEHQLSDFVEELRAKKQAVVIDPGPLRVPGWTPQDLGNFYLNVIDRFVKESWFIDGWQYSHGATKEFLYCVQKGIPCFERNQNPLTVARATNLIQDAATHIESLGGDPAKLKLRLSQLAQLSS